MIRRLGARVVFVSVLYAQSAGTLWALPGSWEPFVAPATAWASTLTPFGYDCRNENGVRYCPGETLEDRVASFDGVPIDVDVTLPVTGDGPFPTVVLLHSWAQTKEDVHATAPGESLSALAYHGYLNDNFYAKRGYAVVAYSARGFGRSCGTRTSRTAACSRGWTHLGDQRYEVRDAQWLLGLLVDEGIADPAALGVAGLGYGGAVAITFAYLNDRVRLPDGRFAPWRSPDGVPLSLGAAFSSAGWSDLSQILVPNGRFLDTGVSRRGDNLSPVGVLKSSYSSILLALAEGFGFVSPPGADPGADLRGWLTTFSDGEPYGTAERAIVEEMAEFHSGFGLPGRPAPLLLQAGWTNDLLTPLEAIRVYRDIRGRSARAPVALQLADYGDARGSNNFAEIDELNLRGAAFLDRYLAPLSEDSTRAPLSGEVAGFLQTCPPPAPSVVGERFAAASWKTAHPGVVRFGSSAGQVVDSDGGDPSIAAAFDPVSGATSCDVVPAQTSPGTALYATLARRSFTLLGLPRVTAEIHASGASGQVAARLWDVSPSGSQRLVSRGVYRVARGQRGAIEFQLNGNGYRFEEGHLVRLELVGNDAPFLRASDGDFSVSVRNALVELPVAELPDGGQVERSSENRAIRRLATSGLRSGGPVRRIRPPSEGRSDLLPRSPR